MSTVHTMQTARIPDFGQGLKYLGPLEGNDSPPSWADDGTHDIADFLLWMAAGDSLRVVGPDGVSIELLAQKPIQPRA